MPTDFIDLLECAYRFDLATSDWIRAIAEKAYPSLGDGIGAVGYLAHLDGDRVRTSSLVTLGKVVPREIFEQSMQTPSVELSRQVFSRSSITSASEATGGPDSPVFQALAQLWTPFGFGDSLGLSAYDGGEEAAIWVFFVGSARSPNRAERRLWSRITAHLTAALRLRAALGGGTNAGAQTLLEPDHPRTEALLEPNGKVAHAIGAAASPQGQQRLRAMVRAIEEARGPLRREQPAKALDLWRGLCAGRWTLIDRFDTDRKRFLIACRNEIGDGAGPASMTDRQRQVARLAALGRTNAEIAYAMGLEESTVSNHVAAVLRKLGLPNRVRLATTYWAMMNPESRLQEVMEKPVAVYSVSAPSPRDRHKRGLTPAEADVAHLIVTGLTNREIARKRGTSIRTIANQVAAIFAKTGAETRAHLAALIG